MIDLAKIVPIKVKHLQDLLKDWVRVSLKYKEMWDVSSRQCSSASQNNWCQETLSH